MSDKPRSSVRLWPVVAATAVVTVATREFLTSAYYFAVMLLIIALAGQGLLAGLRRLRPGGVRVDLAQRRFTLLDAAVLIAATAVGLSIYRAAELEKQRLALFDVSAFRPVWGWRGAVWDMRADSERILPLLLPWSIALLTLRLLRPRPRVRRLAQQPGLVASVCATLAFGLLATWLVLPAGSGRAVPGYLEDNFDYWFPTPHLWALPDAFRAGYAAPLVSFTILGGWVGLALSGRWRPEPSWIDGVAQLVGLLWISVTLIHWLGDCLR